MTVSDMTAGDEALKIIALAHQRGAVRDIDLVGRIGGEEFSVFLPGTDVNRTKIVAERIRAAILDSRLLPNRTALRSFRERRRRHLRIRQATFSELFRQADERLYAAKQNGRNRVEINQAPLDSAAHRRMVH